VPSSQVDVPTGEVLDTKIDIKPKPLSDSDETNSCYKGNISIIESSGYNLIEHYGILRLKGGGDNESDPGSSQVTPNYRTDLILKRKKEDDDSEKNSTSGLSPSPILPSTQYENDIDANCDTVELILSQTRTIIADMITSTKIGKRWGKF